MRVHERCAVAVFLGFPLYSIRNPHSHGLDADVLDTTCPDNSETNLSATYPTLQTKLQFTHPPKFHENNTIGMPLLSQSIAKNISGEQTENSQASQIPRNHKSRHHHVESSTESTRTKRMSRPRELKTHRGLQGC